LFFQCAFGQAERFRRPLFKQVAMGCSPVVFFAASSSYLRSVSATGIFDREPELQ